MSTIIFGNQTDQKVVRHEGRHDWVEIQCKLDAIGQQSADFSIIAEVWETHADNVTRKGLEAWCFDQASGNYVSAFQLLQRYSKWNGCHVDCLQWYYWDNGVYAFENYLVGGRRNGSGKLEELAATCLAHAESTLTWGALSDEVAGDLGETVWRHARNEYNVISRLELMLAFEEIAGSRFEYVKALFLREMAELFGLDALNKAVLHGTHRDNTLEAWRIRRDAAAASAIVHRAEMKKKRLDNAISDPKVVEQKTARMASIQTELQRLQADLAEIEAYRLRQTND